MRVVDSLWKAIKSALWKALEAIWGVRWVRYAAYSGPTVLVLWIGFYAAILSDVLGMNTEEDGWRAGVLADYNLSNRVMQILPPGTFFSSGEGYLLLGDGSSRGARMNGKEISPSRFSTSTAVFNKYNSFASRSVAMHYRELRNWWRWQGETNVRADLFEALSPNKLPADCSESHGWIGDSHFGFTGGTIVEVSKVGHPLLWKTHEVLIYSGGNEFKEMSIVDDHIYECAIMALKSGQSVRVTYDTRLIRNPVTQNTSFNLVGLSNQ